MKILKETAVTEAMLTSSTSAADDYDVWDSGTTYAEGDQVIFGIEAWESLTGTNTDQPDEGAEKDTPTWLRLGYINRWRMFRDGTDSFTSETADVIVTLKMGESIGGVALLNLEGEDATVTVKDSDGATVYTDTQLITNYSVGDWWNFYFNKYSFTEKLTFLDLPAYDNGEITITITQGEADAAQIGRTVLGRHAETGVTEYDTNVSELDFSTKKRDGFGNLQITSRRSVELIDYDISIETNSLDDFRKKLREVRTSPAVYIGSDDHESLIVFGVYKDFQINLSNFAFSDVTLQVEGF